MKYEKFNVSIHCFYFRPGISFLGKFGLKNLKCQFLAEVRYLDKYAQFNDGFHFLLFRPKITFLSKFGVKNQNCQFKLKFGI